MGVIEDLLKLRLARSKELEAKLGELLEDNSLTDEERFDRLIKILDSYGRLNENQEK